MMNCLRGAMMLFVLAVTNLSHAETKSFAESIDCIEETISRQNLVLIKMRSGKNSTYHMNDDGNLTVVEMNGKKYDFIYSGIGKERTVEIRDSETFEIVNKEKTPGENFQKARQFLKIFKGKLKPCGPKSKDKNTVAISTMDAGTGYQDLEDMGLPNEWGTEGFWEAEFQPVYGDFFASFQDYLSSAERASCLDRIGECRDGCYAIAQELKSTCLSIGKFIGDNYSTVWGLITLNACVYGEAVGVDRCLSSCGSITECFR